MVPLNPSTVPPPSGDVTAVVPPQEGAVAAAVPVPRDMTSGSSGLAGGMEAPPNAGGRHILQVGSVVKVV